LLKANALSLSSCMSAHHRIFTTPVAKVYPYYVAKAEKKGADEGGGKCGDLLAHGLLAAAVGGGAQEGDGL
jgi:hypothetical protein